MGVQHITLLDFDSLEDVNLDRTLHGKRADVLGHRSKADVLADGLRVGATAEGFVAVPLEYSVIEPDGFRAALDCDLLISCVDRPWPRSVLNAIAYAHLIPVVDGGILVTTKGEGSAIKGAEWRAHTVAPGRRCMECLGQFSPAAASLEREGFLDDPVYIAGLPRTDGLRRNENVFAFSLSVASMEVLQALALTIAPSGVCNIGAKLYHFVTGREDVPVISACDATCPYPALTANGERAPASWTARHPAAEDARRQRATLQAGIRRLGILTRVRAWFARLALWCRGRPAPRLTGG
jgi:molybdopterin/thiamine biosynthesis adenylyltransferase